jgi:hypothetical protein
VPGRSAFVRAEAGPRRIPERFCGSQVGFVDGFSKARRSGFGSVWVEVLSQLLEESVEIAWVYLQQTGELENDAARYLSDVIEVMIRGGQRNRMFLANMAIIKYRASKERGNVVPIREDVGTVLGSPN